MSADVYAFRRNLVLAASAGTGKTHTLVGVLLHAMLGASEMGGEGAHEPIDPARIVATTFSRKAAAEIRERIVVALSALASGTPSASSYGASLADAATRLEIPWGDALVTKRARMALARIGQASIGTLHGFAYAIARTYALDRGLPPGFALLEEEETNELCESAVERSLVALRARHPEDTRDLVRLSRGTGSLEEHLVKLLLRLDEEGQDAAALVLPSGDAAALDATMNTLAGLAEELLDDAGMGVAAREFLAARKDGAPGPLIAAVGSLFEFTRSKKAAPAVLALAELRDELGKGKNNRARGAVFARKWVSRDRIVPTADIFRQLVAEAQKEMRAGLVERAGLGFGAVLGAARDALRDAPHSAAELSERYDVLVVDEFQDTSRLQRDLIALLWEKEPLLRRPYTVPSLSQVRPSGLLVVGDRKQSIYAFRGADVAVFTETCVELAGEAARAALAVPEGACAVPASPSADFHALRVNYRAAPELLRFANAFSAVCLRGGGGALADVRYVEDTEALLAPEGKTAGTEPRVTWLRPAGLRQTTSKTDDARLAALAIATRREGGAAWRDFAVLAQTNAMLDAMAFELSRRGIPYVVAGRGFFEAQEVQDVLALLRVLVRRDDRAAWLTVLRGPWAGVSDRTLLGLTEPHRGLELDVRQWGEGTRRALIDEADRVNLAKISDTVQRLRRAVARLGPGGALREAVRELALEEVLVLLPRGEQRIANVRKLLRMADREPHAEVLLERATRAREAGTETEAATFSEEDDAVRLLTVHGSKGLAFPVVVVPELGKRPPQRGTEPFLVAPGPGEFQLATKLLDDRGDPQSTPSLDALWEGVVGRFDAERRRLLYVAITRAARELVFVGDKKGGPLGEANAWSVLEELSAHADAVGMRIEERALGGAPPGPPAGQPVTVAPLELAMVQSAIVPIAATTLQDFSLCPRRFQLVHLLDVSEKSVVPFARGTAERDGAALDARSEGTLLHRVLETVPREAFGSATPLDDVTRALAAAGLEPGAKGQATIVGRAERFLRGEYAQEIARQGAQLERELPFVLTVEGAGPSVSLRGTIDLLVRWPDGALDVIDYKRARGPSVEPHVLQLSVYALAAQELFPASRVRAGIVFLGGTPDTPHFATLPRPAKVRSRLVELATALVRARQSERFVRVPVAQCKAIHCGYVGLCHPPDGPGQLALFRGA